MKGFIIVLMGLLVAAAVALAGCTQAAPAPTSPPAPPAKAAEPTKAPAAKPAEPTKAPAAQPTTAPAAAAPGFPAKDKAITFIVSFPAGGGADAGARMVASVMEKDLKTQIQIVNRPGASTQLALTELMRAKPDGYTMGLLEMLTNAVTYLDPTRGAAYTRKDFETVGNYGAMHFVQMVKADSPFKTAKDLVDEAKTRPRAVKIGTSGLMTASHFAPLQFAKSAGVEIQWVHFDGGPPGITAVLGGHIHAMTPTLTASQSAVKSGQARILGILIKERTKLAPDVPTIQEQGYPSDLPIYHGLIVPAGTPKPIVDTLSASLQRAMQDEELKRKFTELGVEPTYMDAAKTAATWAQIETDVKPLLQLAQTEK